MRITRRTAGIHRALRGTALLSSLARYGTKPPPTLPLYQQILTRG